MKTMVVKEIKLDGTLCLRSKNAIKTLQDLNVMDTIDRIIAVSEKDPSSEGWSLVEKYNSNIAPFFIVEEDSGTRVYNGVFHYLREFLKLDIPDEKEVMEMMDQNPDLDFI